MTDRGHTSREFERELRTLRDRLLQMGGRAEQQIARAMECLARVDDAVAAQVIAEDQRIDQDEIEIDELAFLILVRRQPVASDLRFVMLALKVVTDLERIGDLAVNIAKRGRDLAGQPVSQAQAPLIAELSARVLDALKQALDAFVTADPEKAERVIAEDRVIDVLNTRVIAEVLAEQAEKPAGVGRTLALSSVSRYLERIGDHATNIAEMVIYFVRGSDVRHNTPPRSGTTNE